MNNRPTYFEMPNFDTPPSSQLLQLGQIIHDFSSPTTSIVSPPIPPDHPLFPQIHTTIHKNYSTSTSKSTSLNVGVWSQFLASVLGLGADVSLLREKYHEDVFKFEELVTSFIEPDVEYVKATMASEKVMKYYAENPRKPAFVVTGIKVAKGASVERLKGIKRGVEGSVGVDGTTVAGVPVSFGPSAGLEREVVRGSGFEGGSDFVFAYRIKRIFKDRNVRVKKAEEFVKGAVHDVDGGEELEIDCVDGKENLTLNVTGLQKEDFGDELIYEGYKIVDVEEDGTDGNRARVITTSTD